MDILRKEVSTDFDRTVEKVENTCHENDFSVLLTKDVDEIFRKKLDIQDYDRYAFVLACAAPLAKMALDVSKDAGLLFPCSFVIYEEDGNVFVAHASIMKAAVELGLAPEDEMAPVLEETGRRIHKLWDEL
ncbi:MAG: DUF302 domain-containing protein [Candidatus Thorarchaeota archaeon]